MTDTIFPDIRKNPMQAFAVMAFAFASCFLTSLGIMMFSGLMNGLDEMMERSEVPHFLQMHSGSIEDVGFSSFSENEDVLEFQIVPYLNIDSNEFLSEGVPFITGSDDNGVCCQPSSFDYLLSEEGEILSVDDDGVYVPDHYRDFVTEGGILTIAGVDLYVRGFLTDAQMGSSLSSSKRFLVSSDTYSLLRERGREEFLIEARGTDASSGSSLADLYAGLGLPSNGPAVTYDLIRMMNALSDGVMIVLIILSGITAMVISFISLRFIFMITSERDERRIAVLEALGIRKSVIISSYTIRYALLMGAGVLISCVLLIIIKGEPGICIAVHVLIFSVLVLWAFTVLRHITDKNIVSALRMTGRKQRRKGALILAGLLSAFIYFLSFLPGGAASTLASKSFVSSMGIGDADVRIDLKGEKRAGVEEYLSSSPYADGFAFYDTYRVYASHGDHSAAMLADEGNHKAFPLEYSKGRCPEKSGEIALSALLSDDLAADVGDTLMVNGDECIVTGIYGDITNGGRTAKITQCNGDAVWSIAYVNTSDPQNLLSDIHSLFPLAKADTIGSYIENLYGRTVSNITRASKAAFAAAMAIELILLSLISSLMVSRERRTVTLKLAVGIRRCRIIAAYVGRLCIATMSGIALGIISSGILGPMVLSLMLSFLGASGVRFSASHVFAFVFLPLSMILLAAVSSVLGALTVFRIRPCEIRSNA